MVSEKIKYIFLKEQEFKLQQKDKDKSIKEFYPRSPTNER